MKKRLILIFTLILISSCTFTNNQNSTTSNQTCKTIKIPYETLEPYIVKEYYKITEESQEEYKYSIENSINSTKFDGFDIWAYSEVTLKNTDIESGNFTVIQTIKTLDKKSKTLNSTKYIEFGKSKIFRENFDIDISEDFNISFEIIPPKRTLYKQITKYKNFTKYKNITKYKEKLECK